MRLIVAINSLRLRFFLLLKKFGRKNKEGERNESEESDFSEGGLEKRNIKDMESTVNSRNNGFDNKSYNKEFSIVVLKIVRRNHNF